MSNRRNTFSTFSTRPPGRSSFRSPPRRLRETYVAIKMLTAELSSCDRFRTFNNSLRTPVATNSCRWPLNRSLSPPLMVDLPRRSNMVTSPDSRIDISRPIKSFVRCGIVVVVTSHEQQFRPRPKIGKRVVDDQKRTNWRHLHLSFFKVLKWTPIGAGRRVAHAPNHCLFLSIEKSC
jgi:hypothetical protein